MTIPYMHNCAHQDAGWCLACVRKQSEELERLKQPTPPDQPTEIMSTQYWREEAWRFKKELDDMQATFDLRWKADQRAIKMWQAAHPERGNVWPDHADLVVWLLERLDKAENPVELEPSMRFFRD